MVKMIKIKIGKRRYNDAVKQYYICKVNADGEAMSTIYDRNIHDIHYLHRDFQWKTSCGVLNFYDKQEAIDHALKWISEKRPHVQFEIEIGSETITNDFEFLSENEMEI
jgi:hypothetical protein